MITKLEWLIAKKYLKTKRKESFITVITWCSLIGITIGVAVLIIVTSVMNGFRKDLIANIVGIEGQLVVTDYNNYYMNNYSNIINKLYSEPDVTNVGGTINTQSLITVNGYSTGVMVKALSYKDLSKRAVKYNLLTNNAFNDFKNNKKVVFLGKSLAQSLGVTVGGNIKAVFPQLSSSLVGVIPKYVNLKVVGIFHTDMYQYDSGMIFIPLKLGQILFNTKGVQSIEIFIKNPEDVDVTRENLHNVVGESTFITTWKENNMSLITALKTESNVMFLILVLIVMIAAFNIMSSLIMLVRSKTKEIAILKTMGFSSGSIQKIFFIIGLRIGLLGTFLGSVIGILFSLNIERIKEFLENIFNVNLFNENVYFLSHLPADINILQTTLIIVISVLLSILAGIYPAKKAAEIIPAKALRYE